ncbi:alpha/beta fold hydrolase [Mycobacterium sp. C31M]
MVLAIPGWKGTDVGIRTLTRYMVAAGFRVVTVNLPGAGLTARSVAVDDLDALITLIEEAARQLQIGEFILLGHSFGATIATYFAARKPDAIKGLVLVSPVVDPGDTAARISGYAARAFVGISSHILSEAPRYISDRLIRSSAIANLSNTLLARRGIRGVARIRKLSLREHGFAADPSAMATQLRLAFEHGCGAYASAVSLPAAIIAGDRDQMSSPAALDRLCNAFPNGRLVCARGSGHLGHHEDADVFGRLVAAALSELTNTV